MFGYIWFTDTEYHYQGRTPTNAERSNLSIRKVVRVIDDDSREGYYRVI